MTSDEPIGASTRTRCTSCDGALDTKRILPVEMIFQHLDAYLEQARLTSQGISAVAFFV